MEELSPHFRLWALDLVGFGDSRHHDHTRILTIHDHMELTVAFCTAVNILPYAIIGHSMGGAITLDIALSYPDIFEKMILVSPVITGRLGFNLHWLLMTGLGQAVLNNSQRFWPQILKTAGGGMFFPPPYLEPLAARRNLEDFRKSTWSASYGGLQSILKVELAHRLHEIQMPTLIITGTQDPTIPPADSRLAASRINGAQLLEVENCHHHVTDENPVVFHRAVSGFLGIG